MSRSKIILIVSLLGILVISHSVSGNNGGQFKPQLDWPNSPMGTSLQNATLSGLIKYVYDWGIALGGVATFFMILYAGVQYTSSAGDPGKMKAATTKIKSAVTGLILLLSSWLILNTINPVFTAPKDLKTLAEDLMFPFSDTSLLKEGVPPCDFAILYPSEDFKYGSSATPSAIYFKDIRINSNNSTQRIMLEPKDLQGLVEAEGISSARGFVLLTPEEMALDKKGEFTEKKYGIDGKEDSKNGIFKEGGACVLNLYIAGFRLFGQNFGCGFKVALTNLPCRNISDVKFSEQSINCLELVRAVPENAKSFESASILANMLPRWENTINLSSNEKMYKDLDNLYKGCGIFSGASAMLYSLSQHNLYPDLKLTFNESGDLQKIEQNGEKIECSGEYHSTSIRIKKDD